MSTANQGVIHGATEGGVIGEHPDTPPFQFLVGPATGTEANTIRNPPVPIVCWKVEDTRFEFDSSFVTFDVDSLTNPDDTTSDPVAQPTPPAQSDIRSELKVLASQINLNPGCPLSVFGHADPVGPAVDPDGYNKALSGRRATAIYALLISSTQLQTAVGLWQGIATQENWAGNSLGQVQKMQQVTGLPAGTSMSTLITSYLPMLVPPEFAALKIGAANFLAQGADPQGKGDYQGCSSFNPLIIFSQDEEDGFAAGANDQDQQVFDERNLANAPNRRVMVLLFNKGSKVDPSKWPCPSATGDKSGCIKRFWSDGQTRRSTRLPDDDRKYAKTKDTFACRFYDRLMHESPCDQLFWVVRLLQDGVQPLDQRKPLANLPYSVSGVDGTAAQILGTTDQNGVLRIPVKSDPATMTLKIAGLQITLDGGSLQKISAGDLGAQQRLSNLGFFDPDTKDDQSDSVGDGQSTLASAVTDFQKTNNLPDTNGQLDDGTRRNIKQLHGG